MNNFLKPKLTSEQLINKLRDEKGVTFNYVTEQDAVRYISDKNNYMRTASYRRNYQKHLNGKNKGKYINLDFAYLQELSVIDMHLRYLIIKMCIDIEHDLKVSLLKEIEQNISTDGYDIVSTFLTQKKYILKKIEKISSSPYTHNLIEKYFVIEKLHDKNKNQYKNIIIGIDCPVWVLLELLSFGDFIVFYEFYYHNSPLQPISSALLHLIKHLRNACAHNNCILENLNPGTSIAPVKFYKIIKSMPNINPNECRKKMSNRTILEFIGMLYVYEQVVSEKVKYHRIIELKLLFFERLKEKSSFFIKNELLTSSYRFVEKVIHNLF